MYIKQFPKFILFAGILIGFFFAGTAQVTVNRSENKVIIEGKVYYMHVVKPGQTLFSISRAYEVSEESVTKENPGSAVSLQIGQVLKIPAAISKNIPRPTPQVTPQAKPTTTPVLNTTPTDTTYLKHVVKQGETMYSIAKHYSIRIEELEKCNPMVVNHEIKAGQLVNIPHIKEETAAVAVDFTYHKVRRRETVYGIARKYGISEDMLKKYNPELYRESLKRGNTLKIPKPAVVAEKPTTVIPDEPDSLRRFEPYDTVRLAGNYSFYLDSLPPISDRALNVAYLIPFNYRPFEEMAPSEDMGRTKDDMINLDYTASQNDQMLTSRNFLEFLEGSLLAIDSLSHEGISVNIFVFDTQKSPTRVREIIYSREFQKMDLIVGPFFSYEVEIVSEYSRNNRIPMISPLSGEITPIEHNPFLFQLNTGYKTEFERMADYLSQFADRNIVFIHGVDSLEQVKYDFLKDNLMSRLSKQAQTDTQVIREMVYDRGAASGLSNELQKVLSTEKKNLVVIPETDEAFVSIVVTQLYFQLKNYDISVVGMPHWNVYQNIDFMYFHKLSLNYFTPYYFSYDSANVKKFLRVYRNTYHSEPVTLTKKGGSYAFLGYDLSYHFLKTLDNYGKRFILHLNDNGRHALMNDFYFVPVSDVGGFENRSLILVKFSENLDISAEPYNIAIPVIKDEPLPFFNPENTEE